jgi:hypothetical protein
MVVGLPVIFILAQAPPAQARNSAKFKMLSISGSTTGSRDVVYDPLPFTSCSFTQTERINFHSTKPITAYAFSSKAHGSSRVAWSTKPSFSGNLVELEVPGEVTVSRSATYQQVNYVDPETGEVVYGCRHEVHLDGSPATDCTVERSFPVTLKVGGTSDRDESTYVYPDIEPRDLKALDDACEVGFSPTTDAPGLFSRADLFNKKRKRLSDSDRKEDVPFDNATDDQTVTGTIVDELKGELKRLKSG